MQGRISESRIFVTGGTGFLGGHVVSALVGTGANVRALARDRDKASRLLAHTGAEIVVGDLLRAEAWAQALDGCDAVVHAAAYHREYQQPGDHSQALAAVNVEATLSLVREADLRGVRRFVHIGSAGMIGRKPDGSPGDEETGPAGIVRRNLYFRSKLEASRAIREIVTRRGMEVVEVLPGWLWGPADETPTSSGQLILDFVAGKIAGVLDGGGSVVDARDVAAAIVAVLARPEASGRYIVGGRFMSMSEVFATFEQVTGIEAPGRRIPYAIAWLAAALSGLRSRLTGRRASVSLAAVRTLRARPSVSSARAERELDVDFRAFEETVRDAVRWYVDHGHASVTPPALRARVSCDGALPGRVGGKAKGLLLLLAISAAASACHLGGHRNRDQWQQPERVIASLDIRPGEHAADLGAGDGYFTFRLADAAGATGRVYAVDVDGSKLARIRQRAEQRGYRQIHSALARSDGPGLPDGSVDLIFLCNTYHHLEDRVAYFARAKRHLRPGGRIAIIELEDLPWYAGLWSHQTPAETIQREMTAAGYVFHREYVFLDNQNFLVFIEPKKPRSTSRRFGRR